MIEMASGGVILDIGANIGMYFEAMSKSASIVYAFEPHPDNINVMNEEVRKYNNVVVVQAALSNVDGNTSLFVCERNHRQHTLVTDIASDPRWGHSLGNYIEVPSIKLDSYCTEYNISGITGIKIDVEGAEEYVIEGALETLKNNNAIISLETHAPINANKVASLLKECGYIFWNNYGQLILDMEQDQQYFCVKNENLINPFTGEK